jgi:hypothetical protein
MIECIINTVLCVEPCMYEILEVGAESKTNKKLKVR